MTIEMDEKDEAYITHIFAFFMQYFVHSFFPGRFSGLNIMWSLKEKKIYWVKGYEMMG